MAPRSPLAIVTASTNTARAATCIDSWRAQAADQSFPCLIVENGGDAPYMGSVAAFRIGVDEILAHTDAEVIACFHDDLEIHDHGWDQRVLRLFTARPQCGLAGFGGAIGLGRSDLYSMPYEPTNLARIGFRSNLRDAEQHGERGLISERVVCLDGFSQIGRRAFWEGWARQGQTAEHSPRQVGGERPWTYLEDLGVIHHFYDSMLGCLADRYGWETWYLPVACTHYGGRTAVGDPGYQVWANAKTKSTEGDHAIWEQAHKLGYEAFRDVLPLRL